MFLISFDGSCALWEQTENSRSVLESVSSPLKIIVAVVVCVHDCGGRMKGVRSPGAGVRGSCEPPDVGALEPSLGLLLERQVLFTARSSRQPQISTSNKSCRNWKEALG